MKKIYLFNLIATLIFSLAFFVSCGETETSEKDDENTADIEETNDSIDEEEVVDEEADEAVVDDEPVELAYPEVGTTSKKAGDVARNLIFFDELNVEHSLAEWYKVNNSKAKLIWLIFSTYDCSYCKIEKKDIPVLNGKYAKDGLQTILIMNGLLAGPQPSLEPEKIKEQKDTMIMMEGDSAKHTYGYLKSQFEFQKFINSGYPVNVFIDASTMEIVKHFEGWAAEQEFFDETDAFIDGILDIL